MEGFQRNKSVNLWKWHFYLFSRFYQNAYCSNFCIEM